MILIGIDPGTHTGVAVWNTKRKRFEQLSTMMIHQALDFVEQQAAAASVAGGQIEVYFEDARQRRWLGNKGREALQGAGSIKRDCSIWEDFLTDKAISFDALPPRAGMTKYTAEGFARLTGWQERTSEHARDAAMLVFGR